MIDEVNKIFGREFIIAFFVPSLAFIAANVGLMKAVGVDTSWLWINTADPLKDMTLVIIAILVAAFCLMSVNRVVIRILEGYWIFHLSEHLSFIQRWRFRKLQNRIQQLTEEGMLYRKAGKVFPKEKERERVMLRAAQRFPSKANLVLPTSFGNIFRANEDYSRVMYGFESINGWSRLSAVMSKEYREAFGSVRAMTDFWANIWFLSLIFIIEFVSVRLLLARDFDDFWMFFTSLPGLAILSAGVITALIASWQACVAAVQWGEWMKGAFDVFLPVLSVKLGYRRPLDHKTERDFWLKFSQAIVYRYPATLQELSSLRENVPAVVSDQTSRQSDTS